MLGNCSVCASLFTKYAAVLAAFSGFQIFFLSTYISLLFPCLSFLIYCNAHIIPPPGFFVPWTPTSFPSTYLICSFEKSIVDIFPNALHFCRNLLIFHWHCLFRFLFHTVSFNFYIFLLVGIGIHLTGFADTTKSATSNLCYVMHSSLLTIFVSLMFFNCTLLTRIKLIYVWLPQMKKL